MRLTLFFVITSTLSLLASGSYSQNTRVTLDLRSVSVKDALIAIENSSEFFFIYNNELIDVNRKVDIAVKDQKISDVLSKIFDNEAVEITVVDRKIILAPTYLSESQQVDKKVSGKVTDQSRTPLPGVSVVVKGTTSGVTTDNDGNFSLPLTANAKVLVFSFVGMKSQEVPITGRTSVSIVMEEETFGVDEVVVIGYGTQKKADITGSVSLVSSKDLAKVAVTDPLQALQGKAPGVEIIAASGQPGTGYQIRIRGVQSVNASIQPTYVIDGIISDNMGNVNTNDIESISVLKDGASSAIYGARAANGVVLITTKRGRINEAPAISFHTYQGIQTNSNINMKLLNSDQWLQLNDESYTNDGITGTDLDASRGYNDAVLQTYKDANGNYRNTDWLKQIRQTGKMSYYDLSVRGGSEKSTYFTSLNYLDQQGMIISQSAKKFNFRFNSDHKINKFIEFGNTLNIYNSSNAGFPDFNGVNASFAPNPYMQAIRKSPLSKVWEADGGYGINQNQNIEYTWMPPTVMTNEYKRTAATYGATGNIFMKLILAKGLTFTPMAGLTFNHDVSSLFIPAIILLNTQDVQAKSTLIKKSGDTYHLQTDFMLNYDRTFNKVHNISALLGYSQEQQTNENLDASRNDIPLNTIYYLNAGDPASMTNNNGYQEWSLASYIGRVNYDYKGKYLLQATVRRDGSSRFAKQNRWSIFPSYSAGWRISKEDFFEPLSNVVNDFKIRASLGTLGNANIGNYPTYSNLSPSTVILNESKAGGYTLTNAINTDVKWETTQKYNFGIDASFLQSKLYFTADYFISKTTDLLWAKPLPVSAGKYGSPMINAGEMQNKGWEFEFGFREKRGDFSYDVSANLSSVRNEAIDLNGQDDRNSGMVVGQPLYSYYGYMTDGIIKTQSQLDAYKALTLRPLAELGDVLYKDIDGIGADGKLTGKPDGKFDSNDRTFIGKKYADFAYGFAANVSYKRFSFQVQAQGVQGLDLPFQGQSLTYMQGLPMNSNAIILERWNATENPDGNLPRLTRKDSNGNLIFSDLWLSDASYLRINNVNISWDLPNEICQKFLLKDLRIYCSVQNLYTFTKFKGADPDVIYNNNNVYREGMPADRIPQPRTIIMGLKLSF